MRTKKDEILRKAFLEANLHRLDEFQAENPEPVTFSPAFERRMEKLIRKQTKWYWDYTNTAAKRMCAALASFVLVFSMSMSVSAIREPVVDFIIKVKDAFIELFVNNVPDGAPETIETVYTFASVPEGYVEKEQEANSMYAKTIWVNNESEIFLKQTPIQTDDPYELDSEVDKSGTVMVGEWTVYYSTRYESNFFFWATNEYTYTLTCPVDIELDTVFNMIEHMIPKNK